MAKTGQDREEAQAIAGRQALMVSMLAGVYWFDEALQAGLAARGWSQVTRVQSMVLANLASGTHRAVQLARNLGVSRQSMSQTLAEMEERGLIEVAPDPGDRRARIVSFSAESSAIRDDALMILQALEAALAERIGAEAVAALRAAAAADWGAAPVEVAAAVAGAPLPPRKPRGRPPKPKA